MGANIASPITREKRRGFKICIREVEKDAAIARMCIYEMEEKPALPDLSWGSREREAACTLDFQTKKVDHNAAR